MKQVNRYLTLLGAMIVGFCIGMIALFVWAGSQLYEDMASDTYTQDDLDEVVFPPEDWK
jgi:hypothetical protein